DSTPSTTRRCSDPGELRRLIRRMGWKRGLCVEAPHRVLFGVCGSDQYHGSGQAAILCVAPLAGTAIVDSAMRETTIAGALRGPHASFHQSSPLSSPTIQPGTSTRWPSFFHVMLPLVAHLLGLLSRSRHN